MSRDDEIRRVVAEVDTLVSDLAVTVDALTALLVGEERDDQPARP